MFATLDRLRLFNIREFVVHTGRAAMSAAVIAVSGALLIAVIGISGSITGSVDKLGSSIAGDADLEISGVTDGGFEQSLTPEVARVPGVQAAVPMIRTMLNNRLLIGVDPTSGAALHSDMQSAVAEQTGKLFTVRNGVLVGPDSGHTEGQTFTLGRTEVTVAAVVGGAAAERINGGDFVISTLGMAQRITDRTGKIDSILVVGAPDVRSAVTDTVAGRAVVAEPGFRAAQASGVILVLRALTIMAAAVALVVAGFLIYNAMSMAISQRRNVISMMRAIGGRKQTIVRDLLGEAALLGLVGGAIGVALGIIMGRWTIGLLPQSLLQSLQMNISYAVPWLAVPLVLAACVLSCVAASAVAARQVYKVAPIEALAPPGISAAERIGRRLRIAAGIIGFATIAASVAAAQADLGLASMVAVAMFLNGSVFVCFAFFDQLVAATIAVARRLGAPGALAAATIERSPRRVWVTVLSVLIAVAMTVSISGSNANGIDSAAGAFAPAATVDVWVQATQSQVFPTGPLLPRDIEQTVAAVPGVAQVVPGQQAYASIGESKVIVQGIAPGSRHPLFEAMSEQTRARVLAGDGVAVSRDIARILDLDVGSELTVPTPQGPRRAQVLEVFPYFSALTGIVGMSLPLMQQWFDRTGSTQLEVMVRPGADRAAVQQLIRDAVPPAVYVYSGQEELDGMTSSLAQSTVLITAITWIVVLVAAVALLNTLMLSVLERRRELGVLRAIGSSRRFTMRLVLAEAAAIGVVGGIAGFVIGVANQFVNSLAFSQVLGFDVAFRIAPATLLFGLAALLLCLVGAIAPAVRTGRLVIVEQIGAE